jgi:murein DD-endopeptidase MepM/ murein hydrolase activator NlpD
VQVWTVGDLAGTITADRNIGIDDWTVGGYGEFPDIFSHGAISATISAYNPQNLPDGGLVGRVVAAGGIGGAITAATAILQVRSGGQVTAAINAPLVGSVIEFDGAVATEYPTPSPPPSFVDELLADAAEVYDLATSWRVSLAAELATAVNDLAAARDEAADELAELRDEHDERVDELLTKRELAKIQGLASADAERISQRNLLLDQFTQQKTQADEMLAEVEAARDDLKAQRQANFDSFAAQREEILDLMAEVHVEFAELRIERGVEIDQLITLRDATWTALYVQTAPQPVFDQSEFNLWDYAPTTDEMLRMSLVPGNPLLASLYYGTTLTSFRGLANGLQTAVVTSGFGPEVHPFGGQDEPYYQSAFITGKITGLLLITVGTGGLGNVRYIGTIVQGYNLLSNVVGGVRTAYAIDKEGWTVGNVLTLAAHAFGVVHSSVVLWRGTSGALKGVAGRTLSEAADVAPKGNRTPFNLDISLSASPEDHIFEFPSRVSIS